MPGLMVPDRDDAPLNSQETLNAASKAFGFAPNLYRRMSASPAALDAFYGLQKALGATVDIKTREGVALAVSEANGSDYCLAVHSFVGMHVGRLPPAEMALNRAGLSSNPKRAAALKFAKQVALSHGKVTAADLNTIRAAGYDDSEIVAIVALCAQYTFANLMSNVSRMAIDFPLVAPATIAAA